MLKKPILSVADIDAHLPSTTLGIMGPTKSTYLKVVEIQKNFQVKHSDMEVMPELKTSSVQFIGIYSIRD